MLFRAFIRMFNLLSSPEALFSDPDLIARVMDLYQRKDEFEAPAPLGPTRGELLTALGLAAA